jgi:hypothetical protein
MTYLAALAFIVVVAILITLICVFVKQGRQQTLASLLVGSRTCGQHAFSDNIRSRF